MKKKRWTLRKWILLAYGVIALCTTIASYTLASRGSEALTEIPIALLAMFDAAFIAYLAADCMDHHSSNKYRYNADEETEEDEECRGKCGFL